MKRHKTNTEKLFNKVIKLSFIDTHTFVDVRVHTMVEKE